MKIEYRQTTKEGLVQITTMDERWYRRESDLKLFKSSSWVAGYVPKGKGFEEYLKKAGDNAEEILIDAGIRGSKVHNAIALIVARKQETGEGYIDIENELFLNEKINSKEQLTGDECETVYSFVKWWEEISVEYIIGIVESETADYNEEYEFAGTRDLRLKLILKKEVIEERAKSKKKNFDDLSGVWTIDFKTSKAIYTSHIAQISSYQKFPNCENDRLGILQIGYRLNKAGYKFTEIEPRFDLFLAALKFWELENKDKQPKQFTLPQLIKI